MGTRKNYQKILFIKHGLKYFTQHSPVLLASSMYKRLIRRDIVIKIIERFDFYFMTLKYLLEFVS